MNYLRACILAFGGYYFGYEVGIMNPMATPLGSLVYKLEGSALDSFRSNVNSFFTLGALVAVGLAGPLSNTIGRVRWLIILEVIAVGFGYVYTIENTTALYVARAVSGMIAGSNGALGLVTISEMFPSVIAGFSGLFLYIVLTSFILITSLFKPILSTDEKLADNWRLIMLIPSFVGAVRLTLLLLLFKFGAYESPGYLFANLRGESKAVELRKKLSEWFSNVYLQNCVDAKTDKAIDDFRKAQQQDEPTFVALFTSTYRYRFSICCFLNVMQQMSGINFLIFFSTKIFDEISGNGSFMTLVIAISNIAGGVVGSFTVGKLGRKFNLVYGPLVQGVSFGILSLGKVGKNLL
jgi:MFS family permease